MALVRVTPTRRLHIGQYLGQIVTVLVGLLLMTFAGMEDKSRGYEIEQLAIGGAFVFTACLVIPVIRSRRLSTDRIEQLERRVRALGVVETIIRQSIETDDENHGQP